MLQRPRPSLRLEIHHGGKVGALPLSPPLALSPPLSPPPDNETIEVSLALLSIVHPVLSIYIKHHLFFFIRGECGDWRLHDFRARPKFFYVNWGGHPGQWRITPFKPCIVLSTPPPDTGGTPRTLGGTMAMYSWSIATRTMQGQR